MGPRNSSTFEALLDAAEQVLKTKGYAAATSRQIAQEAGLKQQLVYYYFLNMDELLLATFQRRTKRAIERMEAALASDEPLRAIWELCHNGPDARLSSEFTSLANHHKGIRKEIAHFVEQSSRMQANALSRYLKDRDIDLSILPPATIIFLIACISQTLARENWLGISVNHTEVVALVEWCLRRFSKAKRMGKSASS